MRVLETEMSKKMFFFPNKVRKTTNSKSLNSKQFWFPHLHRKKYSVHEQVFNQLGPLSRIRQLQFVFT